MAVARGRPVSPPAPAGAGFPAPAAPRCPDSREPPCRRTARQSDSAGRGRTPVPLSGAAGSASQTAPPAPETAPPPSRRLPRRSVGRAVTSRPSFSERKDRISSLRRSSPPPFHSRRAHRTPRALSRRAACQTPSRYGAAASCRPFPSKLWRGDTELVQGRGNPPVWAAAGEAACRWSQGTPESPAPRRYPAAPPVGDAAAAPP